MRSSCRYLWHSVPMCTALLLQAQTDRGCMYARLDIGRLVVLLCICSASASSAIVCFAVTWQKAKAEAFSSQLGPRRRSP
uniref:Uncharacterized protein n=1 Tax=Ixodes scapularis TaxID=6945 RepID=A0A4D5RZE9_IXOSC